MKCEECIHYDVCKGYSVLNLKDCKHYSPSAQWLHSPYPIGTEMYALRKRRTEQTVYINGKKYKTDVDEYIIEKFKWDWAEVGCTYSKGWQIFDNIEDARKCRNRLNEELREENEK